MSTEFLINNLLWSGSVTTDAQTGATSADNLLKKSLYPGYRSAGIALSLNGSDETAFSASTDFAVTGDLVLEFSCNPDTITSLDNLLDKQTSTGGYTLRFSGTSGDISFVGRDFTLDANWTVTTNTQPFPASEQWILQAIYDASASTVYITKNGVEVAKATGAAPISGCTLSGTIGTSLKTTTNNLYLGCDNAVQRFFDGKIDHAAVADTIPATIGTRLDPTNCLGYWNFDDSVVNPTDSSGNLNDLTGTNLDSTNFIASTGNEWISIEDLAAGTKSFLFYDRRHNLQTGATVRLWSGTPYTTSVLIDTQVATAGEPIIFEPVSLTVIDLWFEISDPGNSDGYISVPTIYIVDSTDVITLNKNWNRPFRYSDKTFQTVNESTGGSLTAYISTEGLYQAEANWMVEAADSAKIKSVVEYARGMTPVLLNLNDTDYYLIYILNNAEPDYTEIAPAVETISLSLREVS